VPRERQSGSAVRGRVRLSKIGNARLRRALYFPASTALRCSPFFQAWAEGLRQRGKSKMSVICAVMRKLVHVAYGVLKSGKPFDPQKILKFYFFYFLKTRGSKPKAVGV
jgi:transposase